MGWQSMKTAPKDGTDILVYEDYGSILIAHYAYGDWQVSFDGDDSNCVPLRWQPLPKPPKVKKRRQGHLPTPTIEGYVLPPKGTVEHDMNAYCELCEKGEH